MARILLIGCLFLVALSAAWASERTAEQSDARPAAAFASGSMSQSNSRSGEAILTSGAMRPGESLQGTVSIANDGDLAGVFALTAADVVDTPGPNGGRLSEKLELVVEDVTAAGSPATVYSGGLAAMPRQTLGTFAPGEVRSYRFTVVFPDGGTPDSETTGDNAYEGSRVSTTFDWEATAADPGTGEGPGTGEDPGTGEGPGDGENPGTGQIPPGGGSPTSPDGPGPTPEPPGSTPDTTAPRVQLSGPVTQRVLRQRGVVVYGTCSESCTLRLAARAWERSAPKRGTSMSSSRFMVAGATPVRMRLKMSKKAQKAVKRALARRRPMVVTVTATASDAAGNSTTAKRNVRVKR